MHSIKFGFKSDEDQLLET